MPDLQQWAGTNKVQRKRQGTERVTSHPRLQEDLDLVRNHIPLLIKGSVMIPALALAISHLAQSTPGDLRVLFSNLIAVYLGDRYGVGSACRTGAARAPCALVFQTTALQLPLRSAAKPSSPSHLLRSGLLSKLGLCHMLCLDSNAVSPSAALLPSPLQTCVV